jgi:hypothetical protein
MNLHMNLDLTIPDAMRGIVYGDTFFHIEHLVAYNCRRETSHLSMQDNAWPTTYDPIMEYINWVFKRWNTVMSDVNNNFICRSN